MTRLTLSDSCACTSSRPGIVLDDDCQSSVVVAGNATRLTVHARVMTGRTAAGDPVFEWTPLYEDVSMILKAHRYRQNDGYVVAWVKVVAPYMGEDVNERCAITFSGLPDGSPLDESFYRVMSVEPTEGVQTYIEAERQIDLD